MSTEIVTSISLDNGRVAYVQDPIEDVVARYKNALEIERDLIEVIDLKGNQGYIDSDAISTISLANIEPEADPFYEGVALVLNVIEDVIKDEAFLPSETESPVEVILSITDSLGAILGLERESAGPEPEFITGEDCEDCDCGFCDTEPAGDDLPDLPDLLFVKSKLSASTRVLSEPYYTSGAISDRPLISAKVFYEVDRPEYKGYDCPVIGVEQISEAWDATGNAVEF